jgi:hypothetical protein
MRQKHLGQSFCALLVGLVLFSVGTHQLRGQSERFSRGQNVVPVYEGWEPNPDGTFTMHFGYFNRNYEEEVDVPFGPTTNFFEPGPADRGQPAHFYPRRNTFMLRIVVPADWGKKELVWTLNFRGKTEKARGILIPAWEINEAVIRGNRGGGRGDVGDVGKEYEVVNQPPSITIEGPAQRATSLDNEVSLSVSITDDGKEPNPPWLKERATRRGGGGQQALPGAPSARAGGAGGRGGRGAAVPLASPQLNPQPILPAPARGQRPGVTWTLHRGGPGKVTFSQTSPPVKEGKATITARFSEPGTYVLRAYADDGVRTTPADVTVTVK